MIDPTEEEKSFLQKLVLRNGELALPGNMLLLRIERLIPECVFREVAGIDLSDSLTGKGWERARKFRARTEDNKHVSG